MDFALEGDPAPSMVLPGLGAGSFRFSLPHRQRTHKQALLFTFTSLIRRQVPSLGSCPAWKRPPVWPMQGVLQEEQPVLQEAYTET